MIPNNPAEVSVVHVKTFLEHDSSPVPMKEMQEFWKSLDDDSKNGIRASVSKWDDKSHFIAA